MVFAAVLPTIKTTVITTADIRCSLITKMSISMPMDTKKSAPKTSRTGARIFSTSCASSVSPMTVPIRNAPAAAEIPRISPVRASVKQSASADSSKVSSDLNLATKLIIRGTKIAPRVREASANIASLVTSGPISASEAAPVEATPESKVRSTTAAKSSTTRIPTIKRPADELNLPESLRTFTRIAELLIETAAPKKIESIGSQPKIRPSW